MDTNDFIFIDKYGKILDEDSLPLSRVEEAALRLARKHQTTVTVAMVVYTGIEPDTCPNCREIMPESGPCWCSEFEESIPFQGEPMAGPERSNQDFYGI